MFGKSVVTTIIEVFLFIMYIAVNFYSQRQMDSRDQ